MPDMAVVLDLRNWIDAFIFDRQYALLSQNTIDYYRYALDHFTGYCSGVGVGSMDLITTDLIKRYLLHLDGLYNSGGVNAKWRAVRAFLNWYQSESINDWANPVYKIKVRPALDPPLEPADIEAVKGMLRGCDIKIPFHQAWLGIRDKLLILMLLDTGARISELLSLTIENVNPVTGVIQVMGKGGKSRSVYIQGKTRSVLRKFLSMAHIDEYLFIGEYGGHLTRRGAVKMLHTRAVMGGSSYQSPHSFRRLFALTMLRSGVDIFTLAILMGHSDIQILRRYLKLIQSDTRAAHVRGSPVERLLK